MLLLTYPLTETFATIVVEAILMLLVFLAPFAVFTLAIHALERISQRRLAERFGWNSVLWTGWLGTPIHELSHAAMCILFRHRVDEVALFEPDRESGRLGFVRHSYRHDNWFERAGNLFIGIAPLLGGSIALIGLLWLFYPSAAAAGLKMPSENDGSVQHLIRHTIDLAVGIGAEIFSPKNFFTIRFWLFLYLVLCIGSHMAPSRSDYIGATQGVVLTSSVLMGGTMLLALIGVPLNKAISSFLSSTSLLFAVLSLSVLLCGVATAMVYFATSFMPVRYRL